MVSTSTTTVNLEGYFIELLGSITLVLVLSFGNDYDTLNFYIPLSVLRESHFKMAYMALSSEPRYLVQLNWRRVCLRTFNRLAIFWAASRPADGSSESSCAACFTHLT